jgi:streptomycin 3"-adenylyltransferase
MINMSNRAIPKEALQALEVLQELLGSHLVGVYLYGSAVMGGLRPNSDVDVLAVTNQSLSKNVRRDLKDRLLHVSGGIGNADAIRPLEVTVINQSDVVPWHYPPKYEFMYGEWLRGRFEKGDVPKPSYEPDLAILLIQARNTGISLFGPKAADILEPVPSQDIRKAIAESLPDLVANLRGDERNVILTLARMWLTVSTGEIYAKDKAAEWAIPRLPPAHAELLSIACEAYRGEVVDQWDELEPEVNALVEYLKKAIEAPS